jgi:hypothetical protein
VKILHKDFGAGWGPIRTDKTEPTRRERLSTNDAVRVAFDTDDTRGDDSVSGTGPGLRGRRSAHALVGGRTGSVRVAPGSLAEIGVVRS